MSLERLLAATLAAVFFLLAPAAATASADNYVPEYQWQFRQWQLTDVDGVGYIEAGDFDGDGLTDIVAQVGAGYNSRSLFFFQREDGLQPLPVEFVMSPFSPFHSRVGVTVADLDRDGRAEVLISTNKGLVVIWVAADRSMRISNHFADDRMAFGPPLVVDVDNDGHLDVVQGEQWKFGDQPNELVIRYGDGAGGFPRTRLIPTGELKYGRLESGDLNGDGHVDLVSRISGYMPVYTALVGILYGDGRGGFLGPDTRLSRFTYLDTLVGDMNNDGRDDMLLVDPQQDNEFVVSSLLRPTEVYFQRADGTLPGVPSRMAIMARSRGYDLVDLDGDGQLDLATVGDLRDGRLGVHLQRDGVLGHGREFTLPHTFGQFGAAPSFYRDSQAYGDFNGDGVTDIVYTGGYGPVVMMAGRLQPYATSGRPPGPPRAVVASSAFDTTNVSVSFQPPLDSGDSPITHYLVEPDPSGGIRDGTFDADPLRLMHGMIGQINGQRYRYRVRAFNAAGPGPLSEFSAEIQIRKLPNLSANADAQFEPATGVANYRFEFVLNRPALEGGVSFDVATVDGTAIAGLDYQAVVLKGVHIPAGSKSVFVDVPIFADGLTEGQEYFDLAVTNVSEAVFQNLRVFGVIRDPISLPTIPTVQVLPPTVAEGNTGITLMRFPILMPLASSTDVSFNVRTIDGSAQAGTDYLAQNTRWVIPAGQTASHFDVQVLPDLLDEQDETLTLFVDGLIGANVFSPSTTGTILDDDTPLDGIPDVVNADSEKGYVDREFSFLSAWDARLSGTAMVSPAYRRELLGADPTPALPFDALATVSWVPVVVPANPTASPVEVRLLAMAASDTAQRVALFVGSGETPSAATTECAEDGAGQAQVCELVLRQEPGAAARRYWALAQNAQASVSAMDSVELEAGAVTIVPVNSELVVSAQAIIYGAPFMARLGWDIPSLVPGERRLGYVLVESAPGVLIYQEPLRLHRTGDLDAPHVLAPAEGRAVHLAAGDAQERLVFDVPTNAAAVTFSMQGTGEASLYVSRDPQPSTPGIAPAPPRAQADAVSSLPGASQSITLSGAQLRAGRWYVTPENRGNAPAALTVRADVVRQGVRPVFRPGHYFNPARPGHGLFLDFAGDQWVMVWYTYLQDGTPTWYYTQGPTPADDNAQWAVDLLRVSRGMDETRAVRVGSATLSILEGAAGASPKIAFGYNLDGDAGWETLTRLGDDTCPMYGGQKLDATGHWFAPADPGYGFSAQVLPNTEIYAAYIYDSPGFPRWLIGQKDFDPTVDRITMQQLSGFCPTCPLVPLQSKAVATLRRTFGTNSSNDGRPGITSLGMYALFEKPLPPGPFAGSAPVYLLSARKGCD